MNLGYLPYFEPTSDQSERSILCHHDNRIEKFPQVLSLTRITDALEINLFLEHRFNFLRNVLEKTATFLSYNKWLDLLPKTADGNHDSFSNRIVNLSKHSAYAGEEVAELEENGKEKLGELVEFLIKEYVFPQRKNKMIDKSLSLQD